MPNKSPLTEREKEIIELLREAGKKPPQICKKMGRSAACVYKYLRILSGKVVPREKLKPGRKHKLSETTRRAIRRRASNATTSAGQIKTEYNLKVSNSTVKQALKDIPYLKYRTKRRVCYMTARNKKDRKACCEARRNWREE
jgi:transposase